MPRRVPPGEAVRLWFDLQLNGVDSRLVLFPDENRWMLTPQNARLWYETFIPFLEQHLRGGRWRPPELL